MIIAGLIAAGLLLGGGISPLAIGDSYASGTGAGNYREFLCMRSADAPIEKVGDFLGVDAVNVACNAAWTDDLVTDRLIQESRRNFPRDEPFVTGVGSYMAICGSGLEGTTVDFEVEENSSNVTAFCTVTLNPQIDAASGATDVFVTIGGNDIGFVSVASGCLIAEDEGACNTAMENAQRRLPDVIESERRALVAMAEGNPGVRIHVVPYPRLVSSDDLWAGSINMGEEVNAFQAEWENSLQAMVEDIDGAYYVDAVTPIWEGHGIGGEDSWIHTSGNGAELLHPTPEGWEAMGNAYIAHLGRLAVSE